MATRRGENQMRMTEDEAKNFQGFGFDGGFLKPNFRTEYIYEFCKK